jgi:hypothetical protein
LAKTQNILLRSHNQILQLHGMKTSSSYILSFAAALGLPSHHMVKTDADC